MKGGVCVDTSFLMSLLVGDCHTERAREQVISLGKPLVISQLVELEHVNGVRQRVFRGEITEHQALAVDKEYLRWRKEGSLVRGGMMVPAIWKSARKLGRDHTARLGTRSLDVLHVAFALAAEADLFWSFDDKQRVLAAAVGLKLNP